MQRAALAVAALLVLPPAAWATFAANDLSCSIHAPKQSGLLARCEGPFSGPGGAITIELHGTAPNRVGTVRLKFANGALPSQSIPLKAEPVIDLETVGVLFMDFNFNGVEDLAVMESLPADANVPYRFYLFDRAGGKFAANASLTALTSPEIKPVEKQIASSWQDGVARSGRDLYQWEEGALVLAGRVERVVSAGACKTITYQREGGRLVLKSKRTCK